jgi:hypothetical protein
MNKIGNFTIRTNDVGIWLGIELCLRKGTEKENLERIGIMTK